MNRITKYSIILQRDFSLCRPVNISFKDNLTWDKNGDACYAIYYARKFTHKIVLDSEILEDNIILFATMAHEYVHAWQYEHGYNMLRHNRDEFPEWVKHFNNKYNVDIINMCKR